MAERSVLGWAAVAIDTSMAEMQGAAWLGTSVAEAELPATARAIGGVGRRGPGSGP
jgi:hypothetical protein